MRRSKPPGPHTARPGASSRCPRLEGIGEGWHDTRIYVYETSPSERREVLATARRSSGERWTVVIEDVSAAVIDKRNAQRALIHSSLLPKGFERESFAGKTARRLGPAEIAELKRFVTTAQGELGVPGISVGVVQDGRVAFAGGFGVRELGKKAPVDENTLFMVASNTKALTTLMLAKLVEEGQIRLGNARYRHRSDVQARKRGDDRERSPEASRLRLHGDATQRLEHSRNPGQHAETKARRARDLRADEQAR